MFVVISNYLHIGRGGRMLMNECNMHALYIASFILQEQVSKNKGYDMVYVICGYAS